MHTRGRPGSSDAGETLIELVVAVAIMGITVIAIVGGFATFILMSGVHREETSAGAYLRSYAETLQGSYACVAGTAPDYASLLVTKPNGFDLPTATVKFWNGASFSGLTCPVTDLGLQQVTLTLKSADTRVSESLVVMVSR